MDEQELERLAGQYADMINRIALNDTRSPADADDILQEGLLSLFTAAPAFESPEQEKYWLIRVTMNKGKNHWRSLLRRSTLPLEETDGYLSLERDHWALREGVAALPRNQRRAVDLYYFEGYSTGEIAAILNAKEATVRTWLHRGRQRLKEYLTEEVTL
mgnify:FL=1